jgi:hypothetical protein
MNGDAVSPQYVDRTPTRSSRYRQSRQTSGRVPATASALQDVYWPSTVPAVGG